MLDLSNYIDEFSESTLSGMNSDYAAVVLEPWTLKQIITKDIREWCTRTGTLLIADEVVTGGRFEQFTASNFLQVMPDLFVLGKGLANGLPLCAVGGTRRIMSVFERD